MIHYRSILRAAGALWFAALLLVLLLVAMACATVFESTHGTEQALVQFYHSRWFALILGLVAINIAAAVAVRFPLTRRHVGFALTHASIVLILAGALVTKFWGLDGRIALTEGRDTEHVLVDQNTLSILNHRSGATADADLKGSGIGRFDPLENPEAPDAVLGDLRVRVIRYLPDSQWSRTVLPDSADGRPAVQVSLSEDGHDSPVWIFENHRAMPGSVVATYRRASTNNEMQEWLAGPAEPAARPPATVRVEIAGTPFDVPLDDCLAGTVPLGQTGYAVRVRRYLPHASVGPGNKLVTLSDRPENPAIEAEIIGPETTETRLAFSRFPEFSSMHGSAQTSEVKLTFIALESGAHEAARAPIEVLRGPTGEFFVRFDRDGGPPAVTSLTLAEPVDSPWPGLRFSVLQSSDRAVLDWRAEPVEPLRQERAPAVLVRAQTEGQESELWLQKHRPRSFGVNGQSYELSYGDKAVPLGFKVTLDRFRVGYYPGGQQPRSFESQLTFQDPAAGGSQSRVVSMNNPAQYGGFTFFQSSYSQEGGANMSVLSVSRDPGQPVVFTGYILVLLGMLVVLATRMREHRRISQLADEPATRPIPLGRCVSESPGQAASHWQGNGRVREARPSGQSAIDPHATRGA